MPEIFDADKEKSDKSPSKDSSAGSQVKKARHQKYKSRQKKHHKADNYSETIRKENSTKNPLIAFAPKPERVHFDSQLKDEEVVLMLRRHPVTQIGKILIAIIAAFMPALIFSSPILDFMPPRFKLAAGVGWYMLLATYIIEAFLTWFFNVFILTDERVIDVDFITLIYKNVSSAKIENIEDITIATGGVLASIVDFGTVRIQTAGEVPELEFESVPHPAKVARILNELILEEEREKLEGRVR